MKIVVSQKGKKLLAEFYHPKSLLGKEGKGRLVVDKYEIDKAENFLNAVDRVVKIWQRRQRRHLRSKPNFYSPVDRFVKKRKMDSVILEKSGLEFINTGVLTERIIRAIMSGLRFFE